MKNLHGLILCLLLTAALHKTYISICLLPLSLRWIGNAAEDGRMATVFARLLLPGVTREGARTVADKGVHAFVVPIRDSAGNLVSSFFLILQM
jgi:hypothetical protein